MNDEYRKYEYDDDRIDYWRLCIVLMVVLMAIGLLSGCKTKYVTVPEYHKEYIVRSDTVAKVDSVVIKDSVFVYHNGDTVIINKVAYRDRVKNVYKVRTDTICKTDSIRVPYQTEKELGKSEKRYMTIGKYLCKGFGWILAAMVVGVVAWLVRKIKKIWFG